MNRVEYYYRNREHILAYQREWKQRNPQRMKAYAQAPRLKAKLARRGNDPITAQKIRARERWNNVLGRRGWIILPAGCEFHHPDYSRPFFGAWVDRGIHQLIHAGRVECPPCVDYSEYVKLRGALGRFQNGLGARNSNPNRQKLKAQKASDEKRWFLIGAIDGMREHLPHIAEIPMELRAL